MKFRSKKSLIFLFCIITVLMAIVLLLFGFIHKLNQYNKETDNKSREEVLSLVNRKADLINEEIEKDLLFYGGISENIASLDDKDKILGYVSGLSYSSAERSLSFIRFYKDGEEFSSSGILIGEISGKKLLNLTNSDTLHFGGIIYEETQAANFALFYFPLADNSVYDSVIFYTDAAEVFGESAEWTNKVEFNAAWFSISYGAGSVYFNTGNALFTDNLQTNNFIKLRVMSEDKKTVDLLEKNKDSETGFITDIRIKSVDYMASVRNIGGEKSETYLTEIYNPRVIYSDRYDFVRTMYIAIAVISIAFVIILTVLIVLIQKNRRRLDAFDRADPAVGWHTYRMFSYEAEKIIDSNRLTNFALVYFSISNFKYILDHYGGEYEDRIQRFFGDVLEKLLNASEAYGHYSSERFVALMNYRDRKGLIDRLKLILAIVYNYPELKKQNYNLKFTAGIYFLERGKESSIDKMLDKAMHAQKTINPAGGMFYNIYDEDVNNQFKFESVLEGRMEQALKNDDFRVYYQPKYNIKSDRIEGAEALVRWCEGEEVVYTPESFVPVFEKNGFIVKLDKYVFTQVCEHMSDMATKGYKVYPVSVNVSRITALQPDFIDFYTKIKQKYKIGNLFLTIELTESFAIENYSTIKQIVEDLKRHGINCAIDDFGVGYSSYNILKEIKMDEIKLDRLFIKPGMSRERDDLLLKATIEFSKQLGFKVTQEGVEDIEDVRRLKRFGCDVIQGYYYCRPISYEKYVEFLHNTATSGSKLFMTLDD